MFNMNQLAAEIQDVVEGLQRNNAPRLHPDWITQEVVSKHGNVHGDDAEFWRAVGRVEVRNQVRAYLNRFKAKAEVETDDQMVLEGFERLQKWYLVTEDGAQVAVHVHRMTSAQRLAKAAEYEAMGKGCLQHARELRRFDEQQQGALRA